MPDVEYWIQIEANYWDTCPSGKDRMTGLAVEKLPDGRPPVKNLTLRSPTSGHKLMVRTMFNPVRDNDGKVARALILRRYTANWAAPDDRKVNPWDLNEPDPTENGTMGTIPGPVMECNVGDRVIVHFRNMDDRYTPPTTIPGRAKFLPTLQRTHSLHAHGFVCAPVHDGAYPLSPPDNTDDPLHPGKKLNEIERGHEVAWANVGVKGRFKQGDRVPPSEAFTYIWNTFGWPTTAGVWLYHDHSVCDMDNVELGAIGIIVIHNRDEQGDVIIETKDLPGGFPNGSPMNNNCLTLLEQVPILPHDLERLLGPAQAEAMSDTEMNTMEEMGQGVVGPTPLSSEAGQREAAVPTHGHALTAESESAVLPSGPPARERTLQLGKLGLELDEDLTRVVRICMPIYRKPPDKAQYLQLYHSFGGAGMCVNGRKYLGNTPTMVGGTHTKMRFGVVGMGSEIHTFHLHGHRWVLPGPGRNRPGKPSALQFGGPMNTPVSPFSDTHIFGPAQSFAFTIDEGNGQMGADPTLVFPARSPVGEWHMHCHVAGHMMQGMMGSLLIVTGGESGLFNLPEGKPCPTMPKAMPGHAMPHGGGNLPKTVTVYVRDFRYDPDPVAIRVGDTVTWEWDHNISEDHSTTSDTGLWDSGLQVQPFIYSHTFHTAGTFPYHCNEHREMHGTVTVS